MAEPILSDNMERAPTELNLSITNNDINSELSNEFLVELRKNIYHGTYNEDVVDHIAKVLKMVDLIRVPGVDSHQLRMKVFPLSLANDAKEWWISKGDEKITTWEELVGKFNELKESKYENLSNTATDSFFKAYEVRDIEKLSQTKRKHRNSINELPNKRRCKAEKFEAIQYSLGPNEEYIAIRHYEYDIWCKKESDVVVERKGHDAARLCNVDRAHGNYGVIGEGKKCRSRLIEVIAFQKYFCRNSLLDGTRSAAIRKLIRFKICA
ncbi:hypothetical protein Tco_0026651 [Tanacetum coccineum]